MLSLISWLKWCLPGFPHCEVSVFSCIINKCLGGDTLRLLLLPFFKLIYLREHTHTSGGGRREAEAEGQVDSPPSAEPDLGLRRVPQDPEIMT